MNYIQKKKIVNYIKRNSQKHWNDNQIADKIDKLYNSVYMYINENQKTKKYFVGLLIMINVFSHSLDIIFKK